MQSEHDNKKSNACGIKYKDCECCLEYAYINPILNGLFMDV